MKIKTILALSDFSVQGNHALERAGQLAAAHGALLNIMYVDMGATQDCTDATARLGYHARQLGQQFGVTVNVAELTEHTAEQVAEKALGADLVVLGHEHLPSWTTFLSGPPALQLMSRCRCPVLVTRVEAGAVKPYEHVLVTVNFTPESERQVRVACALDDEASIELFHAVGTGSAARLRRAEASRHAVKAYRDACIRYAKGRLLSLSDSFDSRRNRVSSKIGDGDPARQAIVQQQYVGADLLVVGKRRSSPLWDFFFGSVARRLLHQTTTDLLLVPHDVQLSRRESTKPRMTTTRGAVGTAFLPAKRSAP